MRGEVAAGRNRGNIDAISIHSPHAGRGASSHSRRSSCSHFNPLAPCGARCMVFRMAHGTTEFQSTRPMRGEVQAKPGQLRLLDISIHSPHAGRGILLGKRRKQGGNFNPLAPCGARWLPRLHPDRRHAISIHSPHAGRGKGKNDALIKTAISIHSPHAGRGENRQRKSSG